MTTVFLPDDEDALVPWTRSSLEILDAMDRTESVARGGTWRFPIAVARGQGLWLEDLDGRRFMDGLSAAGALPLGHSHPVVVAAMQRHLADGLPLAALDVASPIRDAFVEAVLASLPPEFAAAGRLRFCAPSGAEAVETALKLVRTATSRSGVVAFTGASHGHTRGAAAAIGLRLTRHDAALSGGDLHFLPYASCFRCPVGQDGCRSRIAPAELPPCGHFARHIMEDPANGLPPLAGLLVEPVQGAGGIVPADEVWLRGLAALARTEGAALIVDEVQTGWGRTGSLYAFEEAGILPDVVVLPRAIGGGLPLAAIVVREDLDVWPSGAHAGTFRANLLAMTAGLATLRHIEDGDLPRRATAMGARLMAQLGDLPFRHGFVGDVRGRGLMIGIEFVDERTQDAYGRPAPSGALARAVQAACFRRGLLVDTVGRFGAVVRLTPPLIVQADDIDRIAAILKAACQDADLQDAH